MLRGLIHHRRSHLTVALATAVVTAVLSGALLMGDSVRGSLRDLAVNRLGRIDLALESPRFFRQGLVDDLVGAASFSGDFTAAAGAIRLAGSAAHGESGRRAARIFVHGVDDAFLDVAAADFTVPQRVPGRLPEAVINQALATELGAAAGDDLVVSFPLFDAIPRDTLLGRRAPESVAGSLRLTVAHVVPDVGAGGFSLTPHQGAPQNIFVDRASLQRRLGHGGQINSLFLAGGDRQKSAPESLVKAAESLLRSVLRAADLDLHLRRNEGVVAVESGEFVLRPQVAAAVAAVAEADGLELRPVQTYLANALRLGEKSVPYSTIAAVGGGALRPPFKPLVLQDGSPATTPAPDEVLLGQWAAADLGAQVGDVLQVDYYVVGPREELSTETASFTVSGVLAPTGLAVDAGLTPDYPGIADAGNIADWDPPFPVNLSLVRDEDEAYWDTYRGAPKAFFAASTAARLWSSRYGHLTSMRLPSAHEDDAASLERALVGRLNLEPYGLRFEAVRANGLRAARGATDFSQLFLAFSFFLIAAAVMLVALLFGLGVQQRASEIGLLLALGFTPVQVRRRFLAESLPVALAGVLAGTGLGVGYAAGLMAALRSIWRPAIGSSELYLHISPLHLLLGALAALLVTMSAVAMTLRRLSRRPATSLLAGVVTQPVIPGRRRLGKVLAWGALGMALGLLALAVLTGQSSNPGLSFGTGAGLLISGLAFFSSWCRRARRPQAAGNLTLPGMAARNSSWNPGRSILSIALVACATFVIVTVAANRHDDGTAGGDLPAGTGGFRLLAESRVPLYQDLNREGDRFELGLNQRASALLSNGHVTSLRLRPGSDASCLNLYAPGTPRLLGVPDDLGPKSAFAFQKTIDDSINPWSLLRKPLEPGVIPALGDASSVQWILHLGLGQDLVMENDSGEEVRLRIVGLFSRSIFQSELLVSEANFLKHFPSHSGYGYFLIETPAEESDEMAAELESGLDQYGLDVVSTTRRLAQFQSVENTYLSTFQSLGGFGLLLGTLGLGIVLLRNVLERQGELATLRAFGYRRHRLGRLVLAETGFLLFSGVALGSLAALLAVTPRLLAGDLQLPWFGLGRTLGLVLLVGMISGLAAVRGVLRTPLLHVLKSER